VIWPYITLTKCHQNQTQPDTEEIIQVKVDGRRQLIVNSSLLLIFGQIRATSQKLKDKMNTAVLG